MIRLRSSFKLWADKISTYELLFTIVYTLVAAFLTMDATQFASVIPKFSLIIKLIKLGTVALIPIIVILKRKVDLMNMFFACSTGCITLLIAITTNKSTLNIILLALLMIGGCYLKSNKLLMMYFISTSFIKCSIIVCCKYIFVFLVLSYYKSYYISFKVIYLTK